MLVQQRGQEPCDACLLFSSEFQSPTGLRTEQTRHGGGGRLSAPLVPEISRQMSLCWPWMDPPFFSLALHLFVVGDRRRAARARHATRLLAAVAVHPRSISPPRGARVAKVFGAPVVATHTHTAPRPRRCVQHGAGAIPDGHPPRPTPHNWMERVRLRVTARPRVESLYSHLQLCRVPSPVRPSRHVSLQRSWRCRIPKLLDLSGCIQSSESLTAAYPFCSH